MRRPDDRDRRRDEDLVRGILDRTSGPACGRCLERLPALARDDLDPVDRALVQGHLEHCGACRAVAVVLGWLDSELPAMAEVDPGSGFTAAVLARTRRLPSRAAAAGNLTGGAGLMDRVGRWWEQRIQRPLFVWQAAYALTLVLVLLTAAPGAPLRGVPGQVLSTVQAGPGGVPMLGPVLAVADQGLAAGTGFLKQEVWGGIQGSLDRRCDRTATVRRALDRDLRGTWRGIRQGRPGHSLISLRSVGSDLGSFWRLWWRHDSIPRQPTPGRRPS